MKNRNALRVLSAAVSALAAAGVAHAQGILQTNYGLNLGDELGWSVRSAGDVDGDGYGDILAGAPAAKINGATLGRARVISGKTGATIHELTGTVSMGGFAYDVAGVGDLDNDGHADFVVGIRPWDYAAGGPGSAKVFSGKTGALMFTFTGTGTNNSFGGSVNAAGDVDKDGTPDIVVGSTTESVVGVDAGGVWVFSGKTGAAIRHFLGTTNSQLGICVAGAGDVNGDGYADIIAGANTDPAGGGIAGSVHIYSGKTGVQLWQKIGAFDSQMGVGVAGLTDVNGDGLPDVVFGALSDSTQGAFAGKVQVCVGSTGAVIHTLYGPSGSGFGESVGSLGDIDGDGRGDFLVGMPSASNGTSNSGGVKVFSGATAALLFTVYGNSAGDSFGYDAAGAGDVNGDGIGDVVVGAYSDDIAGQARGAVYVYSGRCGPIANFGTGCPGTGGFTPSLSLTGCACPGGSMSLSVTKGLGGSNALLFIGANETALPIQGGCTLFTFPILSTIVAPLSGIGAGAGQVLAVGKLPMGTPLVPFAMQAICLDPQMPRGYSASNGVSITIQ